MGRPEAAGDGVESASSIGDGGDSNPLDDTQGAVPYITAGVIVGVAALAVGALIWTAVSFRTPL